MSAARPAFPTLNLEQAKEALSKAVAAFEVPENKSRMEEASATAGSDPMQKMQALIPLVQEIEAVVFKEYGFFGPGAVMAATMQINMFAPQDPDVANGMRVLAKKLSGQ